MGYPYDKTYLEQIQANKSECEEIRNAYYVLAHKYAKDNHMDPIELNITESFKLLGEAFELESCVLNGCIDGHYFMWDILDALLTPKKEEK